MLPNNSVIFYCNQLDIKHFISCFYWDSIIAMRLYANEMQPFCVFIVINNFTKALSFCYLPYNSILFFNMACRLIFKKNSFSIED